MRFTPEKWRLRDAGAQHARTLGSIREAWEATMLTRVDRVQMAVRDRFAAAGRLGELFAATPVADDTVAVLGARRRTMQAGTALFELLEPAGDGPVASSLARWGEGLFAAGFATPDIDVFARRLDAGGVRYTAEGGRLYLDGSDTDALPAVISADTPIDVPPASALRWLYEVTLLVPDAAAATAHLTRVFGLNAARFCPIASEQYGYHGTLTLFEPPARLDRIEVVQTSDESHAMGRFYARRGPGLYMCFVETDSIDALCARLDAAEARYAPSEYGKENGIFLHPSTLFGMLMGVSRTSYGWTWSGRPDLVRAP
jgi:catechol 2,3-dioxygenase-like lactoylglutathione lyase family enzyme